MRSSEIMQLVQQLKTDAAFRKAMQADPDKALQGNGITLSASESAALKKVDFTQPGGELLAALRPVLTMWGTRTNNNLQEWSTRFDATLAAANQAAAFNQWINGLNAVARNFGHPSLYLMNRQGDLSKYTCFFVWRTKEQAEAFFKSQDRQMYLAKYSLKGVAQITQQTVYRGRSEVVDRPVPPGTYCTVTSWPNVAAGKSDQFATARFEELKQDKAAGQGSFFGGVVLQSDNDSTQFEVIRAYTSAQAAQQIAQVTEPTYEKSTSTTEQYTMVSPTFHPLHLVAQKGADAWLQNGAWLASPDNRRLIEGQRVNDGNPAHPTDLLYFGGKTVQNLVVRHFYVGAAGTWNDKEMQAIDHTLKAALLDANLNSVIQQYFPDAEIKTDVFASESIANSSSAFEQIDVEAMVSDAYKNGTLTGKGTMNVDFGSTVFCFLLSPGTRLFDIHGGDSYNLLSGYHGSVSCARPDGSGDDTVYYAVGVYSQKLADGTVNGIVRWDQPDQSWKNVVATFYHEINEVRTDPDGEQVADGASARDKLGWYSPEYGEIGDIVMALAGDHLDEAVKDIPLADGSGTVPVQLMYSNYKHAPAAVNAKSEPAAPTHG